MAAVFDASEVLWPFVRMTSSPAVPIPHVRASREYAVLSQAHASAAHLVVSGRIVWPWGAPWANESGEDTTMAYDAAADRYVFPNLGAMFLWLQAAYQAAAALCPGRYAEPAACVAACLRRMSASVAEDDAREVADLGVVLAGWSL